MRTTSTILTAILLVTLSAPFASAEPACIQVYPWSELCEGDVGDFLDAVGGVEPACDDLKDCMATVDPSMDCIQVYPWSELCEGDVGAFLCYYACDVVGP